MAQGRKGADGMGVHNNWIEGKMYWENGRE